MPGILKWALGGLDRLTEAGRFTVPDSSDDAVKLMADLVSPVSAFVRECCVRNPKANVAVDDLYAAWKDWADTNGHHAGAKSTFGRDLHAVVPETRISQPTIGAKRVKCYTYIGLLPVHPVQDREPTGKDAAAGEKDPAHEHARPDRSASVCTGCGTASNDANPLVNGLCTGCTGTDSLWPLGEPHSGNGQVRKCKCGNTLTTVEAINSGKCKPCRDKLMAGYDR